MKLVLASLIIVSVLSVASISAANQVFSQSYTTLTFTGPVSASTAAYWFQVGVWSDIGSVNVTGASVQIMTHWVQPNGVATSFWVGLNLPNDAFIQVGYVCWPGGGCPQRFWEYYPPNTANQASSAFRGDSNGAGVGPNGTWHTYSLQSNGNIWSAYIDGVLDGSVNLGVSNSGSNTPYANAEVEGTYSTNIILGPAEFRNLAYRDTNNVWHNVSSAAAYIGLGAGSGTLPFGESIPYGLQVLGVNDWVAGSGLPHPVNNQVLWVGSTVVPEFPVTELPALILCISLVSILVRKKTRSAHPL